MSVDLRKTISVQWRSNGVGRVDKIQGPSSAGAQSSRQKMKYLSVIAKIRTSGYQTLVCFIATSSHSQFTTI